MPRDTRAAQRATRRKKSPYLPRKYFAGLSASKRQRRKHEISKFGSFHWKDPRAYRGFVTNVGARTRRSHYTANWKQLFPKATSLKQKAAATGVPLSTLQKSYDRGMAAWRTGHRPGATQQQWGYARVHSLLLCGKTYRTTDSDLVRAATRRSAKARAWWAHQCSGTRRH